ncbi:isoprenoid biosynthesis protein ElbB [Wolbachia pipientis]|uniref:Isoprenoid biosynthesis protein ElbB n=1 Tax=Wolbachia pipientis TaxID=955 RepID=A0A1E7QL92_WOLPI|nr:isoprenoid biosynthesis glyoxalase ElbB [Wolbachia pipientis]OEY86984.1 isoprenoid biosynthesis protein ElbB [Wolbachia pipientis]
MSEQKLKAAVILSGCGHLDGTEIREAVLSLLVLDQQEVEVKCLAPNIDVTQIVNHVTNEATKEKRNVLIESARISRGEIYDIKEANVEDFDMLVIPGGQGSMKNLSSLYKNKNVLPEFEKLVLNFFQSRKPIGAICISPAVVVSILSKKAKVKVTIGDDKEQLIERLGGEHIKCDTELSIEDEEYNVFSCSAYMRKDESIYSIYRGIKHMIESMIRKITED